MKTILTLLISLNLSLVSCQTKKPNAKQDAIINAKAIEVPLQDGLAKAYFASGCFWCVEAGETIMKTFDLGPSREIGIIKEYIKESILDGIISNDPKKAFDLMLKKGTELGLTIANEK